MCIRDSFETCNRVDRLFELVGDFRFHLLRRGARQNGRDDHDREVNCLLYTSDAADERSSVDLGGRRIIKKKNKTQIDVQACNITNTSQRERQHKRHTKQRQ